MRAAIADTEHRTNLRPFLRRQITALLFLLPALVIYGLFVAYPFWGSIQLSFTNWDGVSPTRQWVGLENYVRALAADEIMQQALLHNLIWIVLETILPLALGLLLATILWDGAVGRTLFRTVLFMPYILATVIVAIIFGLIYNPLYGALNQFLRAIGLGMLAQGWLGQPNTALLSLIAVATWASYGFFMTVLLAGLQNIDMALHDAAKIDGANAWQRFINVTIPQLRHVITLLVSLSLIGGFKVFDLVYVMTSGGPGYHTEVVATYIFKQSFRQNFVGYGTSLSIILTVIILVVSIIFIWLRERGEE
jgi:raffinose/stachyose/melibiose transport system permease protein